MHQIGSGKLSVMSLVSNRTPECFSWGINTLANGAMEFLRGVSPAGLHPVRAGER